MIGGVEAIASAARPVLPFTVTTRVGIGMPGIGTVSSGPTAIATRYEGRGGVRLNAVSRAPSMVLSRSTGVLDTTRSDWGARTMIRQGILKDGSSKQGNALRASSGSKSVK